MNETAVWPEVIPAVVTDKPPTAGRGAFVAVLFLVAGLATSAWVYFQGDQSPASSPFSRSNQVDRWAVGVLAATALAGTGCLLVMAIAAARSERDFATRLKSRDVAWRTAAA